MGVILQSLECTYYYAPFNHDGRVYRLKKSPPGTKPNLQMLFIRSHFFMFLGSSTLISFIWYKKDEGQLLQLHSQCSYQVQVGELQVVVDVVIGFAVWHHVTTTSRVKVQVEILEGCSLIVS